MAEKYTWVRCTGDSKLSNAPALIATVVVTPDDAAQAKVVLYDGESGSDPQIIEIKTNSGISKVINFNPPLETLRGLYVDFTANCSAVLVQFAWGKE